MFVGFRFPLVFLVPLAFVISAIVIAPVRSQAEPLNQTELAQSSNKPGNLKLLEGTWSVTVECGAHSGFSDNFKLNDGKWVGNLEGGGEEFYFVSYFEDDGKIEGTGSA